MLTPIELERLATTALESAIQGAIGEDSIVEFKGDLTEARRCARQIAALCNSVPGLDAIWVIGWDEKRKVFTKPTEEPANWIAKVEKSFDGSFPQISIRHFRYEDNPLLLLHFITDLRPFVTKTQENGDCEVPWRQLNRTRAATRSELLRLIIPSITQPKFEILKANTIIEFTNNALHAGMDLYVMPTNSVRVTIPFYKCSLYIKHANGIYTIPSPSLSWSGITGSERINQFQLIVDGPTFFSVSAQQNHGAPIAGLRKFEQLTLVLQTGYAGSDLEVGVAAPMVVTSRTNEQLKYRWNDPRWHRP